MAVSGGARARVPRAAVRAHTTTHLSLRRNVDVLLELVLRKLERPLHALGLEISGGGEVSEGEQGSARVGQQGSARASSRKGCRATAAGARPYPAVSVSRISARAALYAASFPFFEARCSCLRVFLFLTSYESKSVVGWGELGAGVVEARRRAVRRPSHLDGGVGVDAKVLLHVLPRLLVDLRLALLEVVVCREGATGRSALCVRVCVCVCVVCMRVVMLPSPRLVLFGGFHAEPYKKEAVFTSSDSEVYECVVVCV